MLTLTPAVRARAVQRSKTPAGVKGGAKKRAPVRAAPTVKRVKKGVLDSLFHDDGEGARVEETYLCRSIGARGMSLT